MKNRLLYFKIFGVFILFGVLYSFTNTTSEEVFANRFAQYYVGQMKDLELAIIALQEQEQKGWNEADLQLSFLNCREEYKKCEFVLAYIDNPKYKKFNAPNLVISPYEVSVEEELKRPHGLQVIEDLIYNPGEGTREMLQAEIHLLRELLTNEIDRLSKQKIGNAKQFNVLILDALRWEVYRIEALGLTGFDVPNSLNSIPEAIASLESLQKVMTLYQPLLEEKNMGALYQDGALKIAAAIAYLEMHSEFNTLDRLFYYKQHMHPISAWLQAVVHGLEYNYPSNVDGFDREATHLFASNALNEKFFGTNEAPERIAVGEKLFNEVLLSANRSRSCATCHKPELAFADGLVKNISVDSTQLLLRNTPSLINVGYQARFFYDLRASTLERQSLEVIHNQLEMGGDIDAVLDTLLLMPAYVELFDKGIEGKVTSYKLYQATAAYVSSIKGNNSKLDQYFNGDEAALSASEKNGFNLFAGKAKCATCHFFPMFNGLVPPKFNETEAEILGVPRTKENQMELDTDKGRMDITGLKVHEFAFKTPTLRNVALSAPYMHNGVFETLEEVVEFYNNGGGAGQGILLPAQTLASDSLKLSAQEQADLVNFMKALSDEKFVY